MTESLYPWQISAWSQLQTLGNRLPHAILFYGAAGIGKTAFAEQFAQSLLCESPLDDGRACGECASCGWFGQYSHPDYRRVRPELLEEEGVDGADTPEGEPRKAAKSAKAPSKEIKIDQVRGLADFMNISTHRQGRRVITLYPAEALNTAAANALLKMLEEPAPNTVFLLVSNSIDRLLPTILSRCRKFAMGMPSATEAQSWLAAQGIKDPEAWLAEQGGAPLAAIEFFQAGSRETMEEFLKYLSSPGIDGALQTADRLQKTPVPELVMWLQRWLVDLLSIKLSGRIRYYPRYHAALAALAARVDIDELLRVVKSANERRAVADHPLAPKLFVEDMLLDYSTLFS